MWGPLDGIVDVWFIASAVLSRFNRLGTSRPVGDNTVSRTTSAVGLAEKISAPTSIYSCQRTANRSLPPIPRPRKAGFGRTDRTNPLAADRPSGGFARGLVSPEVDFVRQKRGVCPLNQNNSDKKSCC